MLTHESWFGATLAEIGESTLQLFGNGSHHRFKPGGPPVRFSPQLTLAVVMVLHELATNAVKYGALSNDQGRLILNWDVVEGSVPERIWLRWEQLSGPLVTPPARVF